MSAQKNKTGVFPALLKHWRGRRGMSQLDLALAADVSSRHISFLETGRSSPSAQMVLRLAATLDVSLRQANAMLRAAGHPAAYPEPSPDQSLPDEVTAALAMMKEHHDPFPMLVIDKGYDVLDMNQGALALLAAALPDLAQRMSEGRPNLARLTFDPEGAMPAIVNFEEVGRELLWRIHREALADPADGPLRALLDELLERPSVAPDWREPDLSVPASPSIRVHMRAAGLDLRFMTLVTVFQAPQTVALDELRIETWFPVDPTTAENCATLLAASRA